MLAVAATPHLRRLAPGLALAAGIGAVATVVGRWLPVLGAAAPAVLLGIAVGAAARRSASRSVRLQPGVHVAATTVLQTSVVVLGLQLSVRQVARIGLASLPVMLGTLAMCLSAAWLLGRRLGVVGDVRTLIGVGTGVCGASAIAAVAPVIGAASADVAYAVSTIVVFNLAAVLVLPPLGHLLGMSQHAFGLFAGTAVNDTSSVVATATAFGATATTDAVVVKLVRTLMIVPIVLVLARRRGGRSGPGGAVRLVPWFLVGFLLAAAVGSTRLVPASAHPVVASAAGFLVAVALAGIGLSTDVAVLRRAGPRPLLLGGALWLVVGTTSLALQLL